jgi:response regulator of citrate/malate metabolism
MDPSLRNAASLHDHVQKLCHRLVERYSNLIDGAMVEDTDPSTVMLQNHAIEQDSAQMIAAAQDILTLTRQLKELWLFGSLDTLVKPADEKASLEQAKDFAERIEMVKEQEDVDTTKKKNKNGTENKKTAAKKEQAEHVKR